MSGKKRKRNNKRKQKRNRMNEITYPPGNATRGLTFLMVPAVEVTEKQQQHDAN